MLGMKGAPAVTSILVPETEMFSLGDVPPVYTHWSLCRC